MNIKIYDTKGRLVQQSQVPATGFVQKLIIDLRKNQFASGMYMIVAEGENTRSFEVIKQ